MKHPSSPARVDFGCGYYTGLYRTPVVLPADGPGHVTLILGELHSGHPVRIDVTDLAWFAALESAVQVAIGEGIIEAGMPLAAVTP